ncbi:MAG: LysE family translocator [Alphaproteobacteria bacterium]|nr:LysE family translocator [Alphaproteobacteria bacterium]
MEGSTIYLYQWFALMAVFSLAVISPGPDFVLAVRNSIVYSRRIGIMTAIGFGFGIIVHVTYTLLGMAAVIASSIFLFAAIKYAGAAYLIYLGWQALRSRGAGQVAVEQALSAGGARASITSWQAVRSGFLTNILNPKATLFFLAIFSQIIRVDTPPVWQVGYGLTCAFMVTGWFSIVSVVLTQGRVRSLFLRATKWIDRTCGALMIALGIKVALSAR